MVGVILIYNLRGFDSNFFSGDSFCSSAIGKNSGLSRSSHSSCLRFHIPYRWLLPNLIFGALILCLFLVESGGSSAYAALVNSTAKTFPDKVVSQQ